ncbi:peptidylprolyl isomerase [Methylomarinum sp. Ch1-1]|uniref:Chaperone SurA n=1 Tax=Methylomarinum roseum TaxID=3067653 RepID=A0AAU7NSY9_9GAMM|nr:peptidylprolyl isomerase [Methylomarinum sp. Ch1-1]MDP4519884.1 peptidylprolyl isomerase [Methylomarinum sp. Ch1-1]
MKKIYLLAMLLLLSFSVFSVRAELLDRIVAVVEDDIILDRELSEEVYAIAQKLRANNVMVPPEFVLRKQVLERLIIDRLQRQMAERSGIRVSDEMLRSSVVDIAARNNMTVEQFRQELENQGMSFAKFQESIRSEIIINQLRAREIGSRIKVTDREVAHYLETQGRVGQEKIKYRLGHILISVPEAASATVIQKARDKANQVVKDLRNDENFKQMALTVSDGGNALNGGDLGWRTLGQIPTLFVETVSKMSREDVSEPIRSPSGFHIIKMLEMEGLNKHIVTKTKVRHILIKTNELIDDEEAQKRLLALKQRIADGDNFATLAKAHSDDKGSAINGGDLDWVGPGALVPPFEAAMNKLSINEISEPVQTQFGWHLIQVLDRENRDDSAEFKKQQVREEIRKRKIEEETELWLRRMRDEAFVDINLDRL